MLIAIADCESGEKQFNTDGTVVKNINRNKEGVETSYDVGLYQINSSHFKEAKAMGFDVFTAEGNISYALYLYHTQGTYPWRYSSSCWGVRDV